MFLKWPDKDPDEVLDYSIDWSDRLDTDDTVSTSTWIVPTGLTEDSDTFTSTVTTVWLSDGDLGKVYNVVNRIVTADARTMDQTVRLRIKTK